MYPKLKRTCAAALCSLAMLAVSPAFAQSPDMGDDATTMNRSDDRGGGWGWLGLLGLVGLAGLKRRDNGRDVDARRAVPR
jgi:MYXO-CTERM domain-containing protein